ncbi:hypothetical protein ABN028_28030 [Actinopolymorpha sp. B17G11]|uniref:hypothetical protein n=1 Tax=Actinopolymorpha sp. B17G11 TaxID=3160861 RepID=UPI0032E526AC
MNDITAIPIPGLASSEVAVPAPAEGTQRWAGAPTAMLDPDGATLLTYRVRDAAGDRVVLARSDDGVRFETLTEMTSKALGVAMVERAALVRTATGWRLYHSCAEPGTKAWWIGLQESRDLAGLATASLRRLEMEGPLEAFKDPIVRHNGSDWQAWVCRHPLDIPGAEDRMSTIYATSDDGISWRNHGTILAARPGEWDARGARLTTVLPDGRACYDGRATPAENWLERTGLAVPTGTGAQLRALDGGPVADVRYLEVLALPSGGHRLYYEARRRDGAHELRTELHS